MFEALKNLFKSDLHKITDGNPSFKRLIPVPKPALSRISSQYPGIPKKYLQFLGHVGQGQASVVFTFYSTPLSSEDLYGKGSSKQRMYTEFVYFGDDMGETHYAFDPQKRWALVATNNDTNEIEIISRTFLEFLERYF